MASTQDHPPEPAGDRRAEAIGALLAEVAAPRERVVDDHMFAVDRGRQYPATFRLQLFTAPGTQPVAVVTQRAGDDGGSGLINEGRHYAAAVWQRHCPREPGPPVWIQRLILPPDRYGHCTVVTFPVTGPHQLGHPTGHWRITEQEIARLTGCPADTGRGEGFQPRPPAPAEPQPRYQVAWVARLPRPEPFRLPQCMPTSTPWWRRIGRQIVPSRSGRGCCWQHHGSWQRVSRTAITLIRQAQRAGIAVDDIRDHARTQARAQGISGWELDALAALLWTADGIQIETEDGHRSYINGQHKAQAMLDQGVRRTIIIRWEYPPA